MLISFVRATAPPPRQLRRGISIRPCLPRYHLPGSFLGDDKIGPARERERACVRCLLVLLLDRRLDLCLLDVLRALLLRRRDGLGVLDATGLGLDDGELFLRLDQVEDERVGAREDQGEDEARAVQVKVALCACATGSCRRRSQAMFLVSRCAPPELLNEADAPERNLRLRKSDWVRMSGTAPGPPAVAVLCHRHESQPQDLEGYPTWPERCPRSGQEG